MAQAKMTIVLAWLENTGTRDTGEFERFDGVNYRPKLEVVPQAKSAVWLNAGTAADVEKATDYAEANHAGDLKFAVFTYPTTEKDPLKRAKRDIAQGTPNAIF